MNFCTCVERLRACTLNVVLCFLQLWLGVRRVSAHVHARARGASTTDLAFSTAARMTSSAQMKHCYRIWLQFRTYQRIHNALSSFPSSSLPAFPL